VSYYNADSQEQKDSDADALNLVLTCLKKAEKHSSKKRAAYKDRYRAYRGILELKDNEWESQLSPPYAFQIIETIFSMISAEHPRARVIPSGAKDIDGARAIEKLLNIQRAKDNFNEKYAVGSSRLVMGASPAKVSWAYEHGERQTRRFVPLPDGRFQEVKQVEPVTTMSQPTFTPLDLNDFLYDPSVSRIKDASYVIGRFWQSYESLKADARENGIYRNVEELQQPANRAQSRDLLDDYIMRDRAGLVEVLEFWTRDRLITVGNRQCVIRDEPNPYTHGEIPFVMATPVPDLYSMEGLSEVDLLMDVQAAIWSFLNQRLDNTRLISNGIVMVRDTIDDTDKLVFSPRAIWPVADPAEVQMWTPNHNITQSSLEAERTLKEDLMSISAAIPVLAGASPDLVDQKTATGMTILSNNAMNRVLAKRQNYFDCLREVGRQSIQLNQQLWRGPIEIPVIIGGDANGEISWEFQTISAQQIVCECDDDIEETTESLNRQERRQEALLLFDQFVQAAPALQMWGVALNPLPVLEKLGDAFDIKNISTWIKPLPPPQMAPGGQGGAQPPGPPPDGGGGLPPQPDQLGYPNGQPQLPQGAPA
jgi:hypothetical protein